MNKKLALLGALGLSSTLALTGCVENVAGAGDAVQVSSTADACTVSADSIASGNVTFSIKNEGDKATEFYLLGDDGLRIVAERENITPGTTADLTVSLQPGSYFTACKPGMIGANVGQAEFVVTGESTALSAEDQAAFDQVVVDYTNYVRDEVSQLVPLVDEFASAYMDGNDDQARELYADARVHYERIEPIADALGILDARIDYREVDYRAEAEQLQADDPSFTEWLGFHRMEKDLWVPDKSALNADGTSAWENWAPSTTEQRQVVGEALISDVAKLNDLVNSESFAADQQLTVASVSNGAIGLLEEVAVGKITGEENWWSHTDLWDFEGNIQGAQAAFELVAPIAEGRGEQGTQLVSDIRTEFEAMQTGLDQYGNLDAGFVSYDIVTADQRTALTEQVDALREPLSQLTGTVLE
ncbi:iron uptake system protein EfeO [Gulosibacter molinativorax]|uniref:Peptidase M75 family protein n=1 Tax=Gulosibacter molinativorax TaxID=256821 RepID=A0ABT7C7Z6_9MICO|nr:iron uptake system protein EfeO [Gulosibacter molinativorax]MDJ1371190.1 peptidase M75 family protein [Gulosibacter molinativorax]QUY63005.1 Imelysin [Gulosibacter molinativorax]